MHGSVSATTALTVTTPTQPQACLRARVGRDSHEYETLETDTSLEYLHCSSRTSRGKFTDAASAYRLGRVHSASTRLMAPCAVLSYFEVESETGRGFARVVGWVE